MNLYSGAAVAPNQTFGLTYIEGAPGTAGSYTFDLICTDSAGTQVRRTFTMNVSPIDILGGNLKTATLGTAYSEQLTVVGTTGAVTYTYSPASINVEMAPPGITLSPGGLISGTPTSTGNFTFRATAQDGVGHTFTATYNLAVTNLFGLLVTNNPFASLQIGVGVQTALSTNGTSNYTWSAPSGPLPPGLKLSLTGGTPVLTGAPSAAGTFNYTLRATDNTNPSNFADRFYTVRISPMQAITHGITQLPAGRVGAAYSYTLQVAGGTPGYTFSTLSPTLSPLPPGLSLSAAGVIGELRRKPGTSRSVTRSPTRPAS